ncbi:hypothetical protein [Mesorhizobium sp. M0139]|uniref:hypothetical protein n=1 Tax=Mesorhizobium sp. M0139 TaxID=2956892 RepID=UPI0033360866
MTSDTQREIEIDRLRLAAFKTNSAEDKTAYYLAASEWFQNRHYRTPTNTVGSGELDAVRKALTFYADPANWVDTPSWDGDPECITPKAIPVTKEDGQQICDCGDIARKAVQS